MTPLPSPHTHKPRRTIGYMTNGIYSGGGKGGYHYSLWNGIRETAAAHDVNLVCFIGGSYRISPAFDYEFHRNNVFDLVAAEQLDGIILGSAMLVSTLGMEGLARHYSNLRRGPVVSISLELEDAPRLFIDNYTGARQIVDHLIQEHGYRRIAYLRGPEKNDEAGVRYQAYLDSLRDHDLPFDPALVFLGDFNRPSGEAATQRLLDAFPTGVDALVAANDTMALGAISVLRSRGVLIPGQMAVVGFDDIPDAELSFPPLTTVRQPIYEMGQKAVELLLAHMDGSPAERQVALPTRLVVRNSCGCAGDLFAVSSDETPHLARTGRLSPSRRLALLERMVDALGCPPSQRPAAREQASRLLEAVSQSLASSQPAPAGSDPLAQAASLLMETRPVLPWHRVIPLLYDQRIGAPANPRWPHIWKLAGEIAWFSQSYESLQERAREEQQSDLLRVISQALVITFDQAGLMETIARLFPRLGIVGCWVFLSDQPGDLSQPLRLRLAYDRAGRLELPPEGRLLPGRRLMPAGLLDHPSAFTGIVYSLFYGDTNFGFAVFEMDEPDQKTLEMLTSQINTALQGARVVEDLRHMEAEFRLQANTDPLTGIYNRRMLYALGEPAFLLARRHNLPLSVAMVDIDNFKQVNDQYGHAVGDQVLCKMADFIRERIRGTDIFGRFGGEEFLIILPETGTDGALAFVDRMRKSIQAHPIIIGGLTVRLTVSIGLACLQADRDQFIDHLIDRADQALYQAKQAGKNQVAVFPSAPSP